MSRLFLLFFALLALTLVVNAQPTDPEQLKNWLMDKNNLNLETYASALENAIGSNTISKTELTTLLNKIEYDKKVAIFSALSTAPARAAILEALSQNKIEQKKLLLSISGKDAEQGMIQAIRKMQDPSKQFILLKELTLNEQGKPTPQQYGLLDKVLLTEDQNEISLQTKKAFFSLSAEQNGIDLNQFERSLRMFAQSLGVKDLNLRSERGFVGHIKYNYVEGQDGFFSNGLAKLDLRAIQGVAVVTTTQGFEIIFERDDKRASIEIQGGTLVRTMVGSNEILAIAGKSGFFPIEAFLSEQIGGKDNKMISRFAFYLSTAGQDTLTIEDRASCRNGACTKINFAKDDIFKSSFISLENGKFVVVHYDSKGSFLQRAVIDSDAGQMDILLKRETFYRRGQMFEFARMQLKNSAGDAIVTFTNEQGRSTAGLQKVYLFEKASYELTYDQLKEKTLEMFFNGVGQSSAVSSDAPGKRTVHEIDAKNKIAFYYTGDKPITKQEFDGYSELFDPTASLIEKGRYLASTTIGLGQRTGDTTESRDLKYRNLLNLVIVHQSVDPQNPQLWARADYADGTHEPASIQTTIFNGQAKEYSNKALILNADLELNIKQTQYNYLIFSEPIYKIQPKFYLLQGAPEPSAEDAEAHERWLAKEKFYTEKDSYGVIFRSGELVRKQNGESAFSSSGWERSKIDGRLYEVLPERIKGSRVAVYEQERMISDGVLGGYKYSTFVDMDTGKIIYPTEPIKVLALQAVGFTEPSAYERVKMGSNELIEYNRIGGQLLQKMSAMDALHFQPAEIDFGKTTGTQMKKIGLGSQGLFHFNRIGQDSYVTSFYGFNNGQTAELTSGGMQIQQRTEEGLFKNYQKTILEYLGSLRSPPAEGAIYKHTALEGTVIRINNLIDVIRSDIIISSKDKKVEVTGGGDILGKVEFGSLFSLSGNQLSQTEEKQIAFTYDFDKETKKHELQFDVGAKTSLLGQAPVPVRISFSNTEAGLTTFRATGSIGEKTEGTGTLQFNPDGSVVVNDFNAIFANGKETTVAQLGRVGIEEIAGGLSLSGTDLLVKKSIRTSQGILTDFSASAQALDAQIRVGKDVIECTNCNAQLLRAVGKGLQAAEAIAPPISVEIDSIQAQRVRFSPNILFLSGVTVEGSGVIKRNDEVIGAFGNINDFNGVIRQRGSSVDIADIYSHFLSLKQPDGTYSLEDLSGRINMEFKGSPLEEVGFPKGRDSLSKKDVQTYYEIVKVAQDELTRLGYRPGKSDGKLGDNTETAIKSFQTDLGLGPTGILDGPTIAALKGQVKTTINGYGSVDAGSIGLDLNGERKASLQDARVVAFVDSSQYFVKASGKNPNANIPGILIASGDAIDAAVQLRRDFSDVPTSVRQLFTSDRSGYPEVIAIFSSLSMLAVGKQPGELRFDASADSLEFKTAEGTPSILQGVLSVDAKEQAAYLRRLEGSWSSGGIVGVASLTDKDHLAARSSDNNQIVIWSKDRMGENFEPMMLINPRQTKMAFDYRTFALSGSSEFSLALADSLVSGLEGKIQGTYNILSGQLISKGSASADISETSFAKLALQEQGGKTAPFVFELFSKADGTIGWKIPGQALEMGNMRVNIHGRGLEGDLTQLANPLNIDRDASTIASWLAGTQVIVTLDRGSLISKKFTLQKAGNDISANIEAFFGFLKVYGENVRGIKPLQQLIQRQSTSYAPPIDKNKEPESSWKGVLQQPLN